MTWHVMTQSLLPHGELSDVLMIFRTDGTDVHSVKVVQPFEMKETSSGSFPMESSAMKAPSFGFGGETHRVAPEIRDFLQACVDCAWKLGIRAADYKDQSAEVAAVRDHLHDMRKLAKVTE